MKLQIGLRGSIADDYVRSACQNAHEFLSKAKYKRPISRTWRDGLVLFCYTDEQNIELPDAIPYNSEDCN